MIDDNDIKVNIIINFYLFHLICIRYFRTHDVMGNGNSLISVNDFTERVLGTVVATLSPQLDKELVFKTSKEIKDDDKHCLPLVNTPLNPSLDDVTKQYSEYYNYDKQTLINKYLENHILDSEEHIKEFLKLLVTRLTVKSQSVKNLTTPSVKSKQYNIPAVVRPPPKETLSEKTHKQLNDEARNQASYKETQSINEIQQRSQASVQARKEIQYRPQAPEQAVHTKGRKKLQKRIQSMMSSIDHVSNQLNEDTSFTQEQLSNTANLPEAPETLQEQSVSLPLVHETIEHQQIIAETQEFEQPYIGDNTSNNEVLEFQYTQ